MIYQLEYVVRGTQYTMKYADRTSAIGNACNMMKNRDVSCLQLLQGKERYPLITYRLEDERQKHHFDT